MRVGLLTTYSEPCGIAEYAKQLVKSLTGITDFVILDRDKWNLPAILVEDFDVLHVNHSNSLMAWFTIPMIETVKATGKKVILTLHDSGNFNRSAFTLACNKVIVHHRTSDDGCIFIPHGIVEVDVEEDKETRAVGTSGFPIGHKRWIEIAAAARELQREFFAVAPASRHADTFSMEQKVRAANPYVRGYITAYLSQEEAIKTLAKNSAVLAYVLGNGPGISGSVRMGLSTRKPLVLNRCQQFHDLYADYQDEVEFIEHINVEEIKVGIERVLTNNKRPKRILEDMGWSKIGRMYNDIYLEA